MERLFIHTISITKPKEKNTFQINLPESAEAITGIFVTADKYKIFGIPDPKAERSTGILQLFASDTGEHLYSDNPKNTFMVPGEQTFGEVFTHKLWSFASNMGMLDTWQTIHTTVLDGFYRDFVGALTDTVNYKVRIYLRLKLK